ncbi:MAG: hypothetical protein JNM00_14665 [Flavobacteriales bacterium]|nr:hypothetical protein [Flavobacteriales bacterium]
MPSKGSFRTCKNGHRFQKSSDCPVCPLCEHERKSEAGVFSVLSAPARRALERENIRSVKDLSTWSEAALLQLHGLGPSSLPKLKNLLSQQGLTFKS